MMTVYLTDDHIRKAAVHARTSVKLCPSKYIRKGETDAVAMRRIYTQKLCEMATTMCMRESERLCSETEMTINSVSGPGDGPLRGDREELYVIFSDIPGNRCKWEIDGKLTDRHGEKIRKRVILCELNRKQPNEVFIHGMPYLLTVIRRGLMMSMEGRRMLFEEDIVTIPVEWLW